MADWDTVCRLAEGRVLDVERSTSYHTPALKVHGKLFARLHEDGSSLVVFLDEGERAALMSEDPDTFYITPHYEKYPTMLVWLPRVADEQLAELLVESWRRKAPKRLLRRFDEETTAS